MNHLTSDTLTDYVHGELAPAEDARAYAHLATCGDCRSAYDAEIALSDLLRARGRESEREMPSAISALVWQRVRDAKPSPVAQLAAFLRPVYAIPIAAAVLLGGFLASPFAHPGPARSVDAMYYFQAHAAQAALTPLSEHAGQAFETSMIDTSGSPLVDRAASYAASGALDAVR